MNLLIVGGTGTLGRQIVKQALEEGYNVKCLVRSLRRGNFLKEWGAEVVYGDLSIPETLPPALKGMDAIIDAATVRPTDNYNAEVIDGKGKIALIEAAKLAKIKKFVFFSMLNASKNSNIPLISLKLKIESILQNSGLDYTIFQCSGFFQGLINQYAVPILEKQTIWLLGNSAPLAYLDTQDAAKAIVNSLSDSGTNKKSLSLIGEKFWTSEEIIELCERLSGEKAKISYIPSVILGLIRRFFRFFELTWNISDRLQFSEVVNTFEKNKKEENQVSWPIQRANLEQYLQEYFGKVLKKLKESNYQQANDLPFI
jgi:uncharacterized protein YbjT (DUF2867 family)